jgi:hypothetical protein
LALLASWEKMLVTFSQSTPPFSFGYPQLLAIAQLFGAGFKPEHITQKRHTSKGIYIGIVIGADTSMSVITLRKLKIELDTYLNRFNVSKVFARPMTDDGLKLLRKQKFKNVINDGEPEMNVVCHKRWS